MTIYYKINALRQLYQLPSHMSVQLERWIASNPFRMAEMGATMVIPQLSLHTSGGTIIDIMPYGRQAVAQVFGTVTATQEILSSAAVINRSYPWVRYYARRFGDTTVPLTLSSTAIPASTVELAPADFDALPEIVDGWKEITLRFATPPTMGTGTPPQWRWSASGELAGNRWEVLGTYAPALSGIPGNNMNKVPSPHQLSLATYGAPVSGADINLGWIPGYSPMVSATTDDQTADAVLIFSEDPPAISGFSAEEESQELTGIGLDCGLEPCCIPTALDYVHLSWSPPVGTGVVEDTFTRTSSGWGTADSGQTYTDSGGTVPGNYVVNGTTGTHVLDSANVIRHSTISGTIENSHQRVTASLNVTPAGASIRQRIIGHFVDTNNYDYVDFRSSTVGPNLEIVIANVVGGVVTSQTNVSAGNITANRLWYLDVDFNGPTIRAKAWVVGSPEPEFYQATGTSSFTSGGVGLGSVRSTGNTDTGAVSSFDDYSVGPSTWSFGSYELQRMDTVETEWKTIMSATDMTTIEFNDYEARVGIESSYRIRVVNSYDFTGPWSSTVTATVPEPGVTIGCEGGHLLIFTSNERQDGSLNLAYSSVWEGRVEEGFAFPEAQFVQLQAMYNRDFFVAFRPMERGGEQFSRTVLVQAAAISPETLADFTSLRDMAWADVPYICVRDEDGNRWLATVLVPSGRVLRDRRLYMAPVDIIEVTDTPSEVDP